MSVFPIADDLYCHYFIDCVKMIRERHGNLFTSKEVNLAGQFIDLPNLSQILLTKMIMQSATWIRPSKILDKLDKYDISTADFDLSLVHLMNCNFITELGNASNDDDNAWTILTRYLRVDELKLFMTSVLKLKAKG
jgi:hypothetical protein